MTTAPRLPNDEALEILRRLEPMLSGLAGAVSKLDDRVSKLEDYMALADERGRSMDHAIAKLDGRMTELSARVPTTWSLISIMLGMNAGILALGLALARLLK